jgi:hypothetical protein
MHYKWTILVFGCIFTIKEVSYGYRLLEFDQAGLDTLGFHAAGFDLVIMIRNIGYTDYVEGVAFFFVRIRYPGVNKAIGDFLRCSKSKKSRNSSGRPSTRRVMATPVQFTDTNIIDVRNALPPTQGDDYQVQPEPDCYSETENVQLKLRLHTIDEPRVNFDGITEPYRNLTIHSIIIFIGQVYWKRV